MRLKNNAFSLIGQGNAPQKCDLCSRELAWAVGCLGHNRHEFVQRSRKTGGSRGRFSPLYFSAVPFPDYSPDHPDLSCQLPGGNSTAIAEPQPQAGTSCHSVFRCCRSTERNFGVLNRLVAKRDATSNFKNANRACDETLRVGVGVLTLRAESYTIKGSH